MHGTEALHKDRGKKKRKTSQSKMWAEDKTDEEKKPEEVSGNKEGNKHTADKQLLE